MNKYVLMVIASLLLTAICFVVNPLGGILLGFVSGLVLVSSAANGLLWLAHFALPLTFLGFAIVVFCIFAVCMWAAERLDEFEHRISR